MEIQETQGTKQKWRRPKATAIFCPGHLSIKQLRLGLVPLYYAATAGLCACSALLLPLGAYANGLAAPSRNPSRSTVSPASPLDPVTLCARASRTSSRALAAAASCLSLQAPFRLPSVHHYLDFVRSSASPIFQILGRLDNAARSAAWADIEGELSVFNGRDGWEGPNELLLTVGQRP